jgi:hypothetical protein
MLAISAFLSGVMARPYGREPFLMFCICNAMEVYTCPAGYYGWLRACADGSRIPTGRHGRLTRLRLRFRRKAVDPLHRAGIDAEALGNAPHAGTTRGSQSLTDEVERTSIGGARKRQDGGHLSRLRRARRAIAHGGLGYGCR